MKAFSNFEKVIIADMFDKFKYFGKQIIYLEPSDHVIPYGYLIWLCFKSFNFFRTSKIGYILTIESQNQNIFPIFKLILTSQ